MVRVLVLVAVAVVAVAAVVVVVTAGDGLPSCDDDFERTDWTNDREGTGRAVAKCDWLDGKPIAAVVRALGKPDQPPYHGWYTWEIGSADGAIGPSAWFLLLRVRHGDVVRSIAKTRNT